MKRRHADESPPTAATLKLPAKTLLYCAVQRDPTQPVNLALQEQTHFARAPPAAAGPGARGCELALVRGVILAGCLPESIPPGGSDGWLDPNGNVVLPDAGSLLTLVDDDKRSGLAQASLRDMLCRPSLPAPGTALPGPAPTND